MGTLDPQQAVQLWEPSVATRISDHTASEADHRPEILVGPAQPSPAQPSPAQPSPAQPSPGRRQPGSMPGQAGPRSLAEERNRRQALLGRLAAVFYAGSGLLGLVTLPLPAPHSNWLGTMLVSMAALAVGIAVWFAPWGNWPQRATVALVPPAFALIAFANAFGGSDVRTYGVFFV